MDDNASKVSTHRNLPSTIAERSSANQPQPSKLQGESARNRRPLDGRRAWWAVILLCSLYIISYIDRVIPSLLVEPLKTEFDVGDPQIGLLFGAAFAIFYGILGLPVARLADRSNRKLLIFAGVLVWSICTIGSGLAGTFAILVTLRIGVAIGEAVLSPSAYSMIGDMFTTDRRFLPSAVYAASGNVGTYGSYIAGAGILGWVSSNAHTSSPFLGDFSMWQLVFFCVGLPGILIGLVFLLTTREPPRPDNHEQKSSSIREASLFFLGNFRLFGGLFFGASLITIVIFAYGAWAPEFFHRSYGWSIEKAGLSYGVVGLVCSVLGTLAFSQIAATLTRKGLQDGLVLACTLAACIGCAAAGFAAVAPAWYFALAGLAVMIFCLSGCSNLIVISNQFTVPARFRATAIALMFMCTILIGLGLGPPLVAWLAQNDSAEPADLGPALAILSFGVLLPAVALLFSSRKHYANQTSRDPVGASSHNH